MVENGVDPMKLASLVLSSVLVTESNLFDMGGVSRFDDFSRFLHLALMIRLKNLKEKNKNN